MPNCKLTSFGLLVRTKLLEMGLTQNWLIEQVKSDTGMYLDSSYLSKILCGIRSSEQIESSIKKIINVKEGAE